jgi:hypothetical protein
VKIYDAETRTGTTTLNGGNYEATGISGPLILKYSNNCTGK